MTHRTATASMTVQQIQYQTGGFELPPGAGILEDLTRIEMRGFHGAFITQILTKRNFM